MKQIIFITILIYSLFACEKSKTTEVSHSNEGIYFCDLESTTNNGTLFTDKNHNKIAYQGAKNKSEDFAYSGKYSIKLNKDNPFGLTVHIPNISVEETYKITVRRLYINKSIDNSFIVATNNEKEFYIQENNSIRKDTSGWELLELIVIIPPHLEHSDMKVYLWQAGISDVYFDDLKIEKIPPKEYFNFSSNSLRIYIDESEFKKLQEIRREAFKKGILETEEDSWVKAVIFDKDTSYKADLRLKGDWLDHLKGDKWSFRIKIKKQNSWNGMISFSLQNPGTRYFLHEWIAHKIMEKEDVLTTRYGFIPVYLNDKSLGIYAYEEHFEKQLVESKKRREGPIIKLSEEAFWVNNKLYEKEGKWYDMPIFETAEILPYNQNRTINDEVLKHQFIIAQNLLYQHKICDTNISELFDIESVAKFYALIDLTKMYHTLRWHNQRYYYNPIISKLEIIAFDGYLETGVYNFIERPIIGHFDPNNILKSKPESKINYNFFTDSIFIDEYIKNLTKYSDSSFIKKIMNALNSQLKGYEYQLRKEFPDYIYDRSFLYRNAQMIRDELPIYITKVKKGLYKNFNLKNATKSEYFKEFNLLLPREYVSIYKEKDINNYTVYKVINYLPQNIEIIGISNSTSKDFSIHTVKNSKVKSYNADNNFNYFASKYKGDYVFFKLEGYNQTFSAKINPWRSPIENSPRQVLIRDFKLQDERFYTIDKNQITFKQGNLEINKNIIIPPNYIVIINQGTNIDFTDSALFISYSPIFIKGGIQNKIIIKSSDKSAKGFSIFQAKKRSLIENVEFIGFKTLDYKGWTLTGAVNFYESDVTIKHTNFKDNDCEDALNIIRSDFIVDNCSFSNISSDAFDSDFCSGILSNTSFETIVNDGVDFSGSIVKINNCIFNYTGDKGISVGEKSTVEVYNCTISNSKIGVASKDNSRLNLYDCSINNCRYGLTVYRKKHEFGRASIISNNLKYSNINTLHLVEKGSSLELNHKRIPGYDKNTAKRFY